MDVSKLVIRLKIKYPTNIADDVATVYLEDAVNYVCDFTHQNDAYTLENLSSVVVSIAIENLSKRGTEGLKSQSYSGVSESYNEDISEPLKKQLYKHRRFNYESSK